MKKGLTSRVSNACKLSHVNILLLIDTLLSTLPVPAAGFADPVWQGGRQWPSPPPRPRQQWHHTACQPFSALSALWSRLKSVQGTCPLKIYIAVACSCGLYRVIYLRTGLLLPKTLSLTLPTSPTAYRQCCHRMVSYVNQLRHDPAAGITEERKEFTLKQMKLG